MYTIEELKSIIHPIPQQVTAGKGEALVLTPSSQFRFTAPSAEKGPVKTAAQYMKDFLIAKCGEDCFAADGIPVTLELGQAPAGIVCKKEAYRLTINNSGITVTGFGDSGLFYGVLSAKQLLRFDNVGCTVPAVEVLDWPHRPFRAYKQECRYGSNVMEKEDWLEMIDDLASKKINHICVALYGCWVVQYDGRVAEYLYLPLKSHPEINTPQTVKYYSPTEGKWFNYETLPPIYRDNFFGELVAYAKDRGIDIFPGINSLGHNTLFPAKIPEISPKDENGNPTMTGFCTSNPATYEFLFGVYDQIIDEYLTPNGITTFNILMDEVWKQYGANAERKEEYLSPWCECPDCKGKDYGDIFISHAVKVISHLKEKGMKSVIIANDMVVRETKHMGFLGDRFMDAVKAAGIDDVLLFAWWRYTDVESQVYNTYLCRPNDMKLRSIGQPWNGYYIWSLLTNPMRNIQLLAQLDYEAEKGEGIYAYALWDKSYDRTHDGFADYAWNYAAAGTPEDVNARYVARNFAPMYDEVLHAYDLIDWMTEQRCGAKKNEELPDSTVISPREALVSVFSYYPFCYYRTPEREYPQHFPGLPLSMVLAHRRAYTRVMHYVCGMAKEAVGILKQAAVTPGCNQEAARRMVYECLNIQTLVEDWMAFLKIYDLTQGGDQKEIAPIARARQAARLALMELCEQTKEDWACKGATMRNHSVFMQTFADIAAYIESTDAPQLDLLNIKPIMSKENHMIR